MFGFKKSPQKKGETTYLALDVGTEFIKTVLFRTNKGQVEVIGYDRAPQKPTAMRGALIINLEQVIDVVDISVGHALHQAEEKLGVELALPKDVIIGIAGELVQGVPIVVNVERENPDKKVEEGEVEDIISQIKKQTFEEAKEDIAADTGIKTSQIIEIDTVVNSVYIDGVKVDSPIGFKGKELIYRVYSSFAPKIHVDSIKEVANSLKLKLAKVVVEPYALALGVENARKENFNGVFIDMGGGTTDIALIEGGAIVGTKMFAFGGRVFTKRLQTELGLDYQAAEAMKIDYSDQKLKSADEKRVRDALEKDLPVWLDGVALSLSDFDDVREYPSQFYLCGGGTLLPDVQQKLLAYPWLQELPFGKFPKVNYLFPNQITNVIDLTKKVTHPIDVTPMALARMALDVKEMNQV